MLTWISDRRLFLVPGKSTIGEQIHKSLDKVSYNDATIKRKEQIKPLSYPCNAINKRGEEKPTDPKALSNRMITLSLIHI